MQLFVGEAWLPVCWDRVIRFPYNDYVRSKRRGSLGNWQREEWEKGGFPSTSPATQTKGKKNEKLSRCLLIFSFVKVHFSGSCV